MILTDILGFLNPRSFHTLQLLMMYARYRCGDEDFGRNIYQVPDIRVVKLSVNSQIQCAVRSKYFQEPCSPYIPTEASMYS